MLNITAEKNKAAYSIKQRKSKKEFLLRKPVLV